MDVEAGGDRGAEVEAVVVGSEVGGEGVVVDGVSRNTMQTKSDCRDVGSGSRYGNARKHGTRLSQKQS